MTFLVDAQLPPALARWIASQGHQATHAFDLGFHADDDHMIWERARNQQAVIISKDEDFVDRWLLSLFATAVPRCILTVAIACTTLNLKTRRQPDSIRYRKK